MIRGTPGRTEGVPVSLLLPCQCQPVGRDLTPTQDAEFEDVGGHVDVEDFHKCKIHMNGFQSHPGERRQEEVVKQGGRSHTQAINAPGGQPGVDQKHQVQAQQRQGQVDEDLRGVVPPKLSETENR